jgi:hypothetical protein
MRISLLIAATMLAAWGQYYGVRPERRMGAPTESVYPAFPGTARSVSAKSLTLELHDGNEMHFRCTKKTAWLDGEKKIKPADVKEGAMVVVEGKKAPDGSMDAVTVRVQKEKS